MNVMGVDRVTFCFTRGEFATLLRLLRLPELPGIDVSPDQPDVSALESLSEDGILMLVGEQRFVDDAIALILRSAANARGWTIGRSKDASASLFVADAMCVLAEQRGGTIHLEPLHDFAAAREPALTAFALLGEEARLGVCVGGQTTDAQTADEALDSLYNNI